jgi:hypothetical protein
LGRTRDVPREPHPPNAWHHDHVPLFATTSVRKLLLVFMGCALFVAGGIFLLLNPFEDSSADAISLWFVIAVFGLGAIGVLVVLLLPRQRLAIDSYGITWTPYSDQSIPWSAISGLAVMTIGRSQYLELELSEPDRYPPRRRPQRPRSSLSTTLLGGDIYVPLRTLDRSVEDITSAISSYVPSLDS